MPSQLAGVGHGKRRRKVHPIPTHATHHPPLTHKLYSIRYRLRTWALAPTDLDYSPSSES